MDYNNELINMIGALFIILALIFFLFYLVRHFRLTPFGKSRAPLIRLISSINLAPKRGIAIVEVCGQWLVIGIGAENVNLISKFERPSEKNETGIDPPIKRETFNSILGSVDLKKARSKEEVKCENIDKI